MFQTRIPPPVYALFTAAVMSLFNHYTPSFRWIGAPWNEFGWILIALGVGLDFYSVSIFLRKRTTANPVRPDNATELVVTGAYRISRNPMYLGMVLSLSGWAWLLGSPLCLLMVFAFARILMVLQIVPEETALLRLFGESYQGYSQQVNRWIGQKSRK